MGLKGLYKNTPVDPVAQVAFIEAGNNQFNERGGISALSGSANHMKTPITTLGFRSKTTLFNSDNWTLIAMECSGGNMPIPIQYLVA